MHPAAGAADHFRAAPPPRASAGRVRVSAATMVMTIPTVLLFTVSQRMVMETMTMSGIKG